MKLCFGCGKMTTGTPAYCHNCGKTYDVKLCPRGHICSRSANVCSECGSKELSTPQPRVPLLLRPLLFLLSHIVGLTLLFSLIVFVAVFIHKLFVDPNGIFPLMCIGLYLCGSKVNWLFGLDCQAKARKGWPAVLSLQVKRPNDFLQKSGGRLDS